jgi:imidazolonepropionase-like amidohydrolase
MTAAQTRLWLLTSIALCCSVLKAARLFDGHRMVTPGLVVVTGNQIAGVGPTAAIPPDAQVLDFGDATLSPGFMDAHTHLSMDMTDNWNQDQLDTLQRTVAEQALRATEFVKKTLWAGFTTPEEIPVDLRARLEAARLDLLALFRALDRLDLSPAEIPQRLIRQLDMMKARGTYFVPTLMAAQGLRTHLEKPGYYPPAIEAKGRAASASINQVVKKALAKGVKIAVGTDSPVYPHGHNAEEFRLLVDLGMDPLEALKAGTSVDAELLGVSSRLGSFETGKIADVVAMPGDPVQNIRVTEKVFFVMKEGVIYRNDRGTGLQPVPGVSTFFQAAAA